MGFQDIKLDALFKHMYPSLFFHLDPFDSRKITLNLELILDAAG